MSTAACLWTESERRAWRLPERMTPAEWSDRYRELDGMYSSEPGRFRTSRTPYVIEPLNCMADILVDRVTIRKASQLGFTETLLNGVGYVIDQDPSPLLYVVPTEDDATGLHGQRLKAMVDGTKQVRKHQTPKLNDTRGTIWTFDAMTLRLAWPTPSRLASMPAKRVIFDEIDKFPRFTGKEANPIALGDKRLDTYRRSGAQLWIISTPVGSEDHCSVEFDKSDRRRFWLPCPHCGEFQDLTWSQVKWPENERDPQAIKIDALAWYECVHCAAVIRDGHKPGMLQRGKWCPEGCEVRADGTIVGDVPQTGHRGYEISSLYSPWVTFSQMAAEFLEAHEKPDQLQAFVNSRLAQPWTEVQDSTAAKELRRLEVPYTTGTVPEEAAFVIGAMDVQKSHIWYSFRAYGAGESSWLVEYGRVERHITQAEGETVQDQWRDVVARVIHAEFPRAESGELVKPRLIAMDAGHFTDEVYAFCARYPERVYPVKGANEPLRGAPYRASNLRRTRRGAAVRQGMNLWWIDTHYYKRKLHRMMQTEPGMPGAFYVPAGIDSEYVEQVTAEEQAIVRNRGNGAQKTVWKLKAGRLANHLGDCEVYNLFLADLLGAPRLTPEDLEKARLARRRAEQLRAAATQQQASTPARRSWLPKNERGGWFSR